MKNRRCPSPAPLRALTGLPRLFVTVLVFCLVTAVTATTLFPNLTGKVAASSSAQTGSVRQNKTPPNADAPQDNTPKTLSADVLDQIAAMQQEKRSRTPEQDKLDSQLLQAVKMARGEQIADGVPTLLTDVKVDDAGRTVVDITAHVSDALLENLRALGVEIESAFPRFRSIRAEVPLDKLEAIAAFPEVIFIMPKQIPTTNRADAPQGTSGETVNDEATVSPVAPAARQKKTDRAARADRVRETILNALPAITEKRENTVQPTVGSVTSEGDRTHRADEARGTFNVTGAGIRIGVLSDGVMGLANAQASGDLPQVTILPGQAGPSPNSGEGTAMLEIIHDLAPGAQLFFATAFNGQASFAQNIIDLRLAGCDIIVDDVSYSFETPFQDGQDPNITSQTNGAIIAQAVIDVTNDGALYFSSAGNAGNKNDGTSGVWEGDFTEAGNLTFITPTPTPSPLPSPAPTPATQTVGPVNDFNPDPNVVAQFNTITASPNPAAQVTLFWSDPLAGSANDYDLYVLNSTNRLVSASTRRQNGDDDPIEFSASAANVTGNRVVIARFDPVGGTATAPRYLHLNTNRGRLTFNTPGQTKGHSTARLAYSTAAVDSFDAFPNAFNPSNMVETFSSDGPRRLFFNSDGSPKTPGDFSSTGGELRQKPDLTAADGVSVTGSGGAFPTTFFGTSAAAPHAAAIAGLVKSARPSLTQSEVRTNLTNASIDIEMPGVDRDSGTGIVDAFRAVQATGVQGFANLELGTVTASEVGGNGNASIEPGERGTLAVQLRNIGVANASNITATLTSNTPGVQITPPATRSFSDIAPGGTSINTFEFVVTSSAACVNALSFTLTVNYTGNPNPETLTFTVPTTPASPAIAGTVDATPATGGQGYTATSGTQTGRITRTGAISVCGTAKPNPGVFAATTAFRYDAYTFQNASTAPACITVTLNTPLNGNALGGGDIQYVAYAGSFNPANPSQNYLGDYAGFTGGFRQFSVNLPANTNLVVVVNQANAASTNTLAYTLQISGSNPPCATGAGGVPANQPPVNNVPAAQMTRPNNSLVFSTATGNPITVSDLDAGNNPVQVSLTATNGTLSITNPPGGATFSGNGTATITATDSTTNINTALEGLIFTPTTNFTGAATLTITTNDQGFTGSGGAQTDTDTITINVMNPTFTVNSTGDGSDAAPGNDICADSAGMCTLRAAIEEANARLDANVIAFNLNGNISLESELPGLNRSMTLMGEGMNETVIRRAGNANSNFRIFNVTRTSTVTISNLTIADGRSDEGGGGIQNTGRLTLQNVVITGNTAATEGGGIRNDEGGTITMFGSTVSNNTAVGSTVNGVTSDGFGGGIVNSFGTINVITSTISGNTANGSSTGGGIDNGSTMSMTNSTVSGNSANGVPANGIGDNGGGIWNVSSMTLRNVTVTDNTGAGTSSASGVLAFGGSVNVGNTIIAANRNNTVTADVLRGRGNGTFASQGFNLIGSSPTGIGFDPPAAATNFEGGATVNAPGDQRGSLAAPLDPRLAPLANNSSPNQLMTQTHALLPGSPAIDAGNNTGAPPIDQRGSVRPIDGPDADSTATVDIGAFEFNAGPTADNVVISGVVRSTRGTPLSGVRVGLSGSAQEMRVTDAQGRYSFTVEVGGLYTVSVSRAGFTFNPATRNFGGSVTANQIADFTAVQKGRTTPRGRVR
ncbi:MAG: CSLREA domain-containing protein [Pyrinomonadaceae bacterium MAG19_C2-C3]|nr:CSLREA domain-containing protein [Pyrinomonadaceae bacterium MAG19_C2-C3]